MVDSLGTIANLRWPYVSTVLFSSYIVLIYNYSPFVSPILHPSNPNTLPEAVKSIAPITGPAHPSITSLSCALLHPGVPSCSTAFLHHILLSVPRLARFITTVTLALTILRFKAFAAQPLASLSAISKRIITLTAVLSTAVGSAWGSLCMWNTLLSRTTLPTKRFYLSGALGGLPFAFLANNRSTALYFFRAAIDSAWKTGVKRGFWKGVKGGDLWIVVLSWAVLGTILESYPEAIEGRGIQKGLAWLKGEGFADPVEVLAKKKAKKAAAIAAAQKKAETEAEVEVEADGQ